MEASGQFDYLKYYDDETYLLGEVSTKFRKTGEIDPTDFLTILAWKANRARTYHTKRLAQRAGSFKSAVSAISLALWQAEGEKERLKILMSTPWDFYLATASAILTILYPDEFTVYDYRVVQQLKFGKELAQQDFSDNLWDGYTQFRLKVKDFPPKELNLNLRDCDRYLSGKSYREDMETLTQSQN